MASVRKLPNGRCQAQYRATPNGKVYTKTTRRKVDADNWLKGETAKLVTGTWAEPKTARTTVGEWCDSWLVGYGTDDAAGADARRADTPRLR